MKKVLSQSDVKILLSLVAHLFEVNDLYEWDFFGVPNNEGCRRIQFFFQIETVQSPLQGLTSYDGLTRLFSGFKISFILKILTSQVKKFVQIVFHSIQMDKSCLSS